jgi:hypothetical protein
VRYSGATHGRAHIASVVSTAPGVHLRGRHDARRNRSHHQHRYRPVFSISKVLLPTYLGDSATVINYQRAVS